MTRNEDRRSKCNCNSCTITSPKDYRYDRRGFCLQLVEKQESFRILPYILVSKGIGGSESRRYVDNTRRCMSGHTCVCLLTLGWFGFQLITCRGLLHPAVYETREPNYWYLVSRLESVIFHHEFFILLVLSRHLGKSF